MSPLPDPVSRRWEEERHWEIKWERRFSKDCSTSSLDRYATESFREYFRIKIFIYNATNSFFHQNATGSISITHICITTQNHSNLVCVIKAVKNSLLFCKININFAKKTTLCLMKLIKKNDSKL